MTLENIKKIFIDILELTPGIKSISLDSKKKEIDEKDISVELIDNKYCFRATIILMKNESAKNIINLVSSHLRYKLKQQKLNLGKMHIIIGGLANE